ncbi:MAG: hypothetical protein HYY17_06875 [Planctomycetes bacterium]|nr:hypothetical protein [Planctomycetota bacterium]
MRLRVEGRSSAKGPLPAWLSDAARFDVVGLRPGSTVLDLEAPNLGDASPAQFAQGDFFRDIPPDKSCLSIMDESLADAVAGQADSELYDDDLISVFEDFSLLLNSDVRAIEITGPTPVRVTHEGATRISELRRRTPPSRRVRVAGRIDQIRHSDLMFTLVLESGQGLRGLADEAQGEELRKFWGKDAIVSGRGVFRPSGGILRIEADQIGPPEGDMSMWSDMPRPLDTDLERRSLVVPQGPRSGINAIFGKWPGDESDEEVAARLRQLS